MTIPPARAGAAKYRREAVSPRARQANHTKQKRIAKRTKNIHKPLGGDVTPTMLAFLITVAARGKLPPTEYRSTVATFAILNDER